MPNGNGSPKGNPEGLGEMMKRVLHAVQLAVPIGIITRPNIAQRSNLGTAFGLHKIWIILAAPQHCSSNLGTAFGLHKISRLS